jgi:hypothetical protein
MLRLPVRFGMAFAGEAAKLAQKLGKLQYPKPE